MENFTDSIFLSPLKKCIFKNIFILESRDQYDRIVGIYNPSLDLVLTYDFGVKDKVEKAGGRVFYVDHLCSQEEMQKNNFLTYEFFQKWHLDKNKLDLFAYEGINFGTVFNIHIWNDLTFYVRAWLSLSKLKEIQYESLWLGGELSIISFILNKLEIKFKLLETVVLSKNPKYYFPIHRWMDEQLRSYGVRQILRDIIVPMYGIMMSWIDIALQKFFPKKRIFVQEYYPTRALLLRLQQERKFRLAQGHFSLERSLFRLFRDRPIPLYGGISRYRNLSENLLYGFKINRIAKLKLSDGSEISEVIYALIEKRIRDILPETLRNLKCVINYINLHPISLVVLIGNIGHIAMLVDSVAKKRKVPRYLIINGLMLCDYLDEAKDASIINAYSESIRRNYFKGMHNIVCLGDPRMDQYHCQKRKVIDRINPTITIGTSGFSNIDLNSYLAVEFDFLNDVLKAIQGVFENRKPPKIVLKVRGNGYKKLYSDFIKEYFPGIVCRIDDSKTLRDLLEEADLYISIFSQSILEASTLGIPSIYHKNDLQVLHPPFDGCSELVTTKNSLELHNAITDFQDNSERFNLFMNHEIIEKYIGPLDGRNLSRNLEFIEKLLENN